MKYLRWVCSETNRSPNATVCMRETDQFWPFYDKPCSQSTRPRPLSAIFLESFPSELLIETGSVQIWEKKFPVKNHVSDHRYVPARCRGYIVKKTKPKLKCSDLAQNRHRPAPRPLEARTTATSRYTILVFFFFFFFFFISIFSTSQISSLEKKGHNHITQHFHIFQN